jgi:nitroreductase
MSDPEVTQTRTPTQEINPVFVNRWSPRGMTGEELDDEDLMALFEAARWAPSSYNN